MEEKIIKLKAEIQKIKTSQATQVDSYVFYRYSTGNIFSAGATRTIKFCPKCGDSVNVICQFRPCDYYSAGERGDLEVKVSSPLECVATMPSAYTTTAGNYYYVECISNVEGVLLVS